MARPGAHASRHAHRDGGRRRVPRPRGRRVDARRPRPMWELPALASPPHVGMHPDAGRRPRGGGVVKIVFLLAQRVPDVPSPVVEAVSRLLTHAGHVVDGWIPEHRLLSTDSVADEGDLYVLKSHTE